MKKLKSILIVITLATLMVLAFSCVCLADSSEMGIFWAFNSDAEEPFYRTDFTNVAQLNYLLDSYDDEAFDVYIRLSRDINLGEDYIQPAFDGEYDSCSAFLLENLCRPLAESIQFVIADK